MDIGDIGHQKFMDATMGEIGHPMLSLPSTRLKSQHPNAKMCVLRVLFPMQPVVLVYKDLHDWYDWVIYVGQILVCKFSSTMVRIWVSVSEFIIEIW